MTTNVAIDDELIEEAKQIGGHETVQETVTAALKEYIRYVQRVRLIEAFGTVDFDPGYDHKAERARKSQ